MSNNTLRSKIIKGPIGEPQKTVIYGPQGIGKSTLAAQFPNPIFLDTERGSRRMDVDRVEINTLEDYESVIKDPGLLDYGTGIIDTIDWLEQRYSEALCQRHKKASIEDFGYGKGFTMLGEEIMRMLGHLDTLVSKGMNIVLLGHSLVTKFDSPELASAFDRYELDLNKKHVAPLVKHWCDALLFYNWKTKVRETEGLNANKGVGGKERVLHCVHSAAWDAKNRHQLADEEPATIATIQKAFKNVGAPWGRERLQTPAPADGPQGEPATGSQVPLETKQEPEQQPNWMKVKNGEKIDTIPQTDGIPGLAPDNGGPADDQLAIVLKGNEDKALAWLRARGRIGKNQGLSDVSDDQRGKILANPTGFIKTINAATV